MAKAQGTSGRGNHGGDGLLRGRQLARRRHVDGLLEERTVQRIRLVEDGERLQDAVHKDAFDRLLAPRDERLDQDVAVCWIPLLADVSGQQEAADALDGPRTSRGVVHAYHPPAPRQRQRLDNRGVGEVLSGLEGGGLWWHEAE